MDSESKKDERKRKLKKKTQIFSLPVMIKIDPSEELSSLERDMRDLLNYCTLHIPFSMWIMELKKAESRGHLWADGRTNPSSLHDLARELRWYVVQSKKDIKALMGNLGARWVCRKRGHLLCGRLLRAVGKSLTRSLGQNHKRVLDY